MPPVQEKLRLLAVADYNPAGGGSARRMFERDKDILRQIGVPLRASGTGDQCRYRIEEEDYALAPLRLDAAQTAALDLAVSAWRDGSLPVAARRALTKLRAVSPGSEAEAERRKNAANIEKNFIGPRIGTPPPCTRNPAFLVNYTTTIGGPEPRRGPWRRRGRGCGRSGRGCRAPRRGG